MKEHLEILKEEMENQTARIFDIREADEWKQGHLAEAQFVPLSELKEGRLPLSLDNLSFDKEHKTYLYCRSGNRVHPAKELLKAMGFKHLVTLSEGFVELTQNGFLAKEET